MSAGYAITTYKIQLNYKHLDWFKQTQSLFDSVLAFYYHLLEEQPEALELSNQNLLRHLELQTIKQRDGKQPENPIPYEKIPLYFRRGAINAAISLYRIYSGIHKAWEDGGCKGTEPGRPKRLHMSMRYYKGMYKDFDDKSIMLKLYTGKSWSWVKHRYTGRPFPENAERMSPTIVIRKKKVMLHVPVKEKVEDIRTAKERVRQKEKFVAVALTTSDSLAVCTTFQADGTATAPYFIKGGKELAHRRKQLLGYTKRHSIKKPPSLREGDHEVVEGVVGNAALSVPQEHRSNAKYYDKITRVTDHYAHEVSRKIVDYAVKQGAKLIVMPAYGDTFEKGTLPYLKTDIMAFIGRRIIRYTKYKAWQAGIIVQLNSMGKATKQCYKCGEVIYKYNTEYQPPSPNFLGGKNFRCKNKHRGSTALNTARNIGKSFYQAFYEEAV